MAGSVTIEYENQLTASVVTWTWTSDSSGDVSGTDTLKLSGQALRFVTDPSATAPTADYDITILDENGVDIAAAALADRHTSTSEQVIPDPGPAFSSKLSLVVANAGNAKIGTLKMYYR